MISHKKIEVFFHFILLPALSFILAQLILGGSNLYTILALIAAVYICFFIPSSIILYLIILLVFSVNWMSDVFLFIPRQLTWLPDLFILILFSRALIKLIQAKTSLKDFPFLWFLIGNIFLIILSLIANGENFLLLLPAIKIYLKYIILAFSIFLLHLDVKIYHNCFKLLIVIVLAQIPVTIIQALHVGGVGDYGGGTLGANASGLLSVVNGLFICIFLENYFSSHKKKYFLASLLLFIPAIAGATKFSFISYPIIYLYYFIRYSNSPKTLLTNIASIGIFILILSGFMNIFDKYDKGYLNKWLSNPNEAYEYEIRVSGGATGLHGRIGSLKYAMRLAKDNIFTSFFGHGACSSTESFLGTDYESKIYRSGAFQASMPAIPKLIVELGILGIGLYLLFCYALIKLKNHDFLNEISLFAIVIYFIIASFYGSTFFEDQTAIIFWLLICFMHKRVNHNNSIILLDKKNI